MVAVPAGTLRSAKAKELAGERTVAVAAGDVGGQALALGLVDEVAMDVVPVVFGSGKRRFTVRRSASPSAGARPARSGGAAGR